MKQHIQDVLQGTLQYNKDRPKDALRDLLLASDFCKELSRELRTFFGYPPLPQTNMYYYSEEEGSLVWGAAQKLCYSLIWGECELIDQFRVFGYYIDNFKITQIWLLFKKIRDKHKIELEEFRRLINEHYGSRTDYYWKD